MGKEEGERSDGRRKKSWLRNIREWTVNIVKTFPPGQGYQFKKLIKRVNVLNYLTTKLIWHH